MVQFDDLPSSDEASPIDVHSAAQFRRPDLERIFGVTDRMRRLVGERGGARMLEHRLLGTMFYEPSTRTASSFVAAMERLGGSVIPLLQGSDATSAAKGESLEDTMRTLSQYADAIVLRHPEPGSAPRAAEAAEVPLLNAGDGTREHPTQALLDVFTMVDQLEALDGSTVALAGDLRYGRTVHSLVELLGLYDVELQLISPPALRLPGDYRAGLEEAGVPYSEGQSLEAVLPAVDVLYMTRIQEERFEERAEYERHAGTYRVGVAEMETLGDEAVLMHPLPRVDSIDGAVDSDPRAVYFEQVRNGMFVRMALLAERVEGSGGEPIAP